MWNWWDKQNCAVKWLFWENILFLLFSQSAILPVYLFVSLFVNLYYLSYYFSVLNIFQGFSVNFVRTLGCTVDKLLNGFRLINKGSLFLESKAWKLDFVLRQHGFPTKPKVKVWFLTFSRHGQNWTVLYFFL